jgi:hypothetical protein
MNYEVGCAIRYLFLKKKLSMNKVSPFICWNSYFATSTFKEDFSPQYLEWYYCYFHSTEKEKEEKTESKKGRKGCNTNTVIIYIN